MLRAKKKKKKKHLSLKFTVHASALTKQNLLGFLSDKAAWCHWASLSACVGICSCSSLVFYVSDSGSFCVTCSPFYPSLSFSLSGCSSLFPYMYLCLRSTLRLSLCSHSFFLEPPKQIPFLSAFKRRFKKFLSD